MKNVIIVIFCFFMTCSTATADMYYEYIEYRHQPLLGKITIISSKVNGQKYVDYVKANWKELSENNIFTHGKYGSDKKRRFDRSVMIGKRKIDIILEIYPPGGSGMGGALPTTRLKVAIDGKPKIDCNMRPYLNDMFEQPAQIEIYPGDNSIFMDGRFFWINDSQIITNTIFQNANL